MPRRVAPGEPLSIPAREWNQLVAGLEQGLGAGPGRQRGFRQAVTALVRNDTGATLPRFGVVGIGAPLLDPDDDEAAFLEQIVFAGELATNGDYDLKWGLTLAPIASGEIGEAVVQGLSFAKLDTADATEAGPADDGDVNALTEASCGLARVLYRQSGVGDKWAIVCLG